MPLFTFWYDGANGGNSCYGGVNEKHIIDRTTYRGWNSIFAITHKLQPSAVIFGAVGPDVRLMSNEERHAGETCWATFTPETPNAGKSH